MKTYTCYACGKGNQSYMMKDENGDLVCEAKLVKFHLFSACDYEFINYRTGKTEMHKIGKTVNNTVGDDTTSMVVNSYFKYDGVKIMQYLGERGCRYRTTNMNPLHMEMILQKNGEEIAKFRLHVKGERQENVAGIGNTQYNTIVETDEEDLEFIFLSAFTLNRIDYNPQLM